jgi:hypothetical protein
MPPGLRHAATTNGKESSVKPIAIFVRSLQNIIKERVVFRKYISCCYILIRARLPVKAEE